MLGACMFVCVICSPKGCVISDIWSVEGNAFKVPLDKTKNIQGHCERQFKVCTAMNIKIMAFHMLK